MFINAIRRHIANRADQISVIVDGRRLTWAELGVDVDGLSAWLAREGFLPNDVVGLTVADEYRHFVTSLALMQLGCVQITLPSHEPRTYREILAQRTKAVAVVASDAADGLVSLPCVVPDASFRAQARRSSCGTH